MTTCGFVEELSKLRKSSKDSVDDTKSFDDFKKYIHVTREIETDLKSILKYINKNKKNRLFYYVAVQVMGSLTCYLI